MDFFKAAQSEQEYTRKNRRYLHEHPELTWYECNTLAFIKKELTNLQIEYTEVKYGGIIGKICGKKKSADAKVLLLRADMDALPVEECEDNLCEKRQCISQNPGVSHMCGHDAHTAMLLTSAKILKAHEEDLNGDILLMFERGEEGGENCYFLLKYLQENQIKIDGCWAMHIHPDVETGKIAVLDGGVMAGLCAFNVTLKGIGGHGSRPDLSNNPVDCFAAIQMALQSMVLRKISPFETLTYSTCQVEGSQKMNVIPGELTFGGTARFYEVETVGKTFKESFCRICDNISAAYECEPEYNLFIGPLASLKNHPQCVKMARTFLTNLLGAENVVTCEPLMSSESMSYTHLYYPGVYCFLGTKNPERGYGAEMHHPKFDLDEEVMNTGVAATLAYVSGFLNEKEEIDFSPYNGDMRALFSDGVDKIRMAVDY